MILKAFSDDLKELFLQIEDQGFVLTLIGGAIRDRLMGLPLGEDLDFEIRSKDNCDWEKQIEKFRRFLKAQHLTVEALPYLITRVKFKNYDLEFSSPRIEKLLADNKSHHHFEATCSPLLSYADSFKRRDLTLNAIGIEFNFRKQEETMVDPYQGQKDIQNKVLKHVSQDFYADQVRFLRLIRFSILFDKFQISEETKKNLHLFDLSELSSHHLKKEITKSKHAALFINRMNEMVSDYKIKLRDVLHCHPFPESLTTIQQIISYLAVKDEKKANDLSQFFNLPEKNLKEAKSFLKSWEIISQLRKEEFQKIVKEDLSIHRPLWVEFKNLYDKKEFSFLLPYLGPSFLNAQKFWDGKLPDVTAGELEETPVEVRSFLKIQRHLKTQL